MIERPRQVFKIQLRLSFGDGQDAARFFEERFARGGGHDEQFAIPIVLEPLGLMGSRVLFEDGVGVDAPESEGVDAGAARIGSEAVNPWARFGVEVEVGILKAELGVRILDM